MPELRPTFPQGDARNAIVEAALAVFAAEGFHGAGTRHIAQSAGISQPLLNHHFGGKEALWRVVGEQITADFIAFMADVVDLALPPGDAVTAMLRAYLAFWKARPLSFRFNLWRRLDGLQDERVSRSEQITRPVVALMQRAQDAGFIRSRRRLQPSSDRGRGAPPRARPAAPACRSAAWPPSWARPIVCCPRRGDGLRRCRERYEPESAGERMSGLPSQAIGRPVRRQGLRRPGVHRPVHRIVQQEEAGQHAEVGGRRERIEPPGPRVTPKQGDQGDADNEAADLCRTAQQRPPTVIEVLLHGQPERTLQAQLVRQLEDVSQRRQERRHGQRHGEPSKPRQAGVRVAICHVCPIDPHHGAPIG